MSENAKGTLFERFTPILLGATIILSFFVGVLWTKVSSLEKGRTANVAPNPAGNAAAPVNGKLSPDQVKKIPAVSDKDHIIGKKDEDVVIIEYSDYECPFCERFHPTMQQAVKEYGDRIAWVYRQYPLISIHPRAMPAANASECVANIAGNDAFWKFTDAVFGNQEKYLTDSGLADAAVLAGVNKSDFDSCFSEKRFESAVTSQQKDGETAGITGTPGSFVMNKKGDAWLVSGAVPFDSLKATIDEALSSN